MICGVCGNYNPVDASTCLRCGSRTANTPGGAPSIPQGGWAPRIYSLSWLGNALTVLFSIVAVLMLTKIPSSNTFPAYSGSGIRLHVSGIAALMFGLLMLATIVLFLNWFYRARSNVGLTSWRQRWSPAWAIWAWFLPPVFLWFPYQIMADIWRAGMPPDRRTGAANAALPRFWWALWILAWITSFQYQRSSFSQGSDSTVTTSYILNFGGTKLSAAFAAAAAIVLVVIIRKVSAGLVGHPLAPSNPHRMPEESSTG
jgi:Domain of unknown function (DUF4328)